MEPWFLRLLKISWQGAVLILLVLAVQWILGGRLNARWRCWLWLLVAVRLAVPWTLPARVSLFNILNLRWPAASAFADRAAHEHQTSTASQSVATAQAQNEASAQPPKWGRAAKTSLWLIGIWLAGTVTLGGFVLAAQYRLSRRLVSFRPLIDGAVLGLLEDCKQTMGVRAPVMLIECEQVGSPSLFGFVRPRLLLPAGLTKSFSLQELRYVFLHELSHIKRRDILTGWVMTALQLVHWFNPLVWLAFYRMRADRELACDAMALSYAREDERQPYGGTIIKLLESFGQSAWAPSLAGTVEDKNQLKERMRMIAKFKKSNRGAWLAAALFAGLGLVTLTDAEPSTAGEEKSLVGTWILIGEPGNVGAAPAVGGRIKSITDTGWSITQTDPQTSVTIFHHGGTYTLKGDEYIEKVEYANENTKSYIGNVNRFRIKFEGDTFSQIGIENPWKEIWQRVKPDSAKPRKAETADLQGKWQGDEGGAKSSMVIHGTTLEFHGATENEWYKGSFSLYEMDPKQMVLHITDCPFPQYKDRTGYAIYKLENGVLTITGNEPGALTAPAAFDAPAARKIVFKRRDEK